MIKYTLNRSRRKTIVIHVTKDASVEVRAPLKASKGLIDEFVASKEQWVVKNVEERKKQLAEKEAFSLNYGSTVLLLGRECPIEAYAGKRPQFDGGRLLIPTGLSAEKIKDSVVAAYRAKAKEILSEKIILFSKRMGVTPRSVTVSGARTRWGSCSGKNAVSFSWRLIMADEETVDYVVVHELAHIAEHNHSPRFWAIVAKTTPDYALRRKQLKLLHSKLSSEDW